MTKRFGQFVHRLNNGRWVVAEWDEEAGQYHAPMTDEERRLTGCHTYFARTLGSLGATSYAQRSSALRRARQVFGEFDSTSNQHRDEERTTEMTRDEIIRGCLAAMDNSDLNPDQLIEEARRVPLEEWRWIRTFPGGGWQSYDLDSPPTVKELVVATWHIRHGT